MTTTLLARLDAFAVPLHDPPVISHDGDAPETLPGLRVLRDQFVQERESSNNAPYLVAVWDELVHARQPVAIYRTFSPARGSRPVKVDVVAENGARWVRVNTTKNARLLMEFREFDSYLTSDDDESRPRLAETEFDNSVLRMGRELLAAAKANPMSTGSDAIDITPRVTIRLTRLDPSLDDDPRIAQTIQRLRDMDIDVQLGERPYSLAPMPETPVKTKTLEPTTNINLDLSALIALVSDISHSPLPRTEKEARARFEPPRSYLEWKKDRVKSLARQNQGTRLLHDNEDGESEEDAWENSGQHSRALAAQAIQETSKGLLQEIHERISAIVVHPSTGVAFWTTSEARRRCLQIVSKIGGERERQRADALLGSTLCARLPPVPPQAHILANGVVGTGSTNDTGDAYWRHSRYPAGYLPLIPVRVYPLILPTDESRPSRTTFFDALARTCIGILSHEAIPVLRVSAPSAAEEVLEDLPPAVQTSSSKLTVHTVASMLAGASRGHTTLTTNRSSVKGVLKEMRRVYGKAGYEPEAGDVEKAALWVVDPRSLSEGMRSTN